MNDNLDLLTGAITILVFILFFCFISTKDQDTIEKMTCIYNKNDEERLRRSYLWDQDYEDNYMFKFKNENKILEQDLDKIKSLLSNKSTFGQDNLKIKNMFKQPKKVVYFIEEMIDFLLIDDSKDYREKIDENTTWNLIIHLLLIIRLRKIFHCRNLQRKLGDDSPTISYAVNSILSQDIVKLCRDRDLISYCKTFTPKIEIAELDKNIVKQEMEAFEEGQNLEIDGRTIVDSYDDYETSFGIFSIKDSVNNFGEGYFNDKILNSKLKEVIKNFEDKKQKKFDKYDTEDMSALIRMFLDKIHIVLDEMESTKDGDMKLYDLQLQFNPMRELFYNLKFHYKILSIYNLIDKSIDNKKDKEQAFKCCGNGKGQCFNFSKEEDDEGVLLFGTNKYGYIKDSKCHPESMEHIQKKQSKLLTNLLDEEEDVWKNLDKNIKSLYIEYLEDLINYITNSKPKIQDKIRSKTVLFFLEKMKKLDKKISIQNLFISELRSNLIPISWNVNNFLSDETKNVISLIQEAKSFNKIVRLINDIEAGKKLNDNFDFISLENIELIKFSVIKLLEISSLFIHLKSNQSLTMPFLKIVLNLVDSDLNYYELLKKAGILPRNHGFFLEKLKEILKDNTYIKLLNDNLMLSNKPKQSISYNIDKIQEVNKNKVLKNIFPHKTDDVCDVFKPILYILRSQKKITPEEYLKYKNLIGGECFKRYKIYDPNEKKRQPFTSVEDDYNKMVKMINSYIKEHPN